MSDEIVDKALEHMEPGGVFTIEYPDMNIEGKMLLVITRKEAQFLDVCLETMKNFLDEGYLQADSETEVEELIHRIRLHLRGQRPEGSEE